VDIQDLFSLWCITLSFVFTLPQAVRVVLAPAAAYIAARAAWSHDRYGSAIEASADPAR